MKKKVSVIVPVYNVEKYLSTCLESLVNQTLKELEIIVVNDGSLDNSQAIIDEYQLKYPDLIKSYRKENGGLSDARNYGIRKSSGEYLAFIDSDDFVELNTFEVMYQKAKQNDFDVVACNLKYIYEDSDKVKYVSSNVKKDIVDANKIKKLLIHIYPSACNKIYKRQIFENNFEFKKGILFEDVEFTHRLISKIQSLGTVNEHFIIYRQRGGSITKTPNKKIFDYVDNMNGILEYYKSSHLYDRFKKELEYTYVRYLYATFIKQAILLEKKDYLEAVSLAQKNVKKNFPYYRFNRYFYLTGLKGGYLLLFHKWLALFLYHLKHSKI